MILQTGFSKIVLACLIFLAAVTLQLKFLSALGWSFDLLLMAILIPTFFLDGAEFIFFGIFSAFIFRIIYPFNFGELAVLALLPIAIFILKRILFWQSWFEPLLAAIFGILGIYLLVRAPIFADGIGFLAMDVAVSFVFAWGLYALFTAFIKHGR